MRRRPPFRTALLGEEIIRLTAEKPRPGTLLTGGFSIPAARNARSPLTATQLRRGTVIVSTLPNIEKHACALQIVELEDAARIRVPDALLVHVSADDARHWREVDEYHGDRTARAYSLHDATERSRTAFARAFGVGVEGHRRIAHGLFALSDGVFLRAIVPRDQMRTPDVERFLCAL